MRSCIKNISLQGKPDPEAMYAFWCYRLRYENHAQCTEPT